MYVTKQLSISLKDIQTRPALGVYVKETFFEAPMGTALKVVLWCVSIFILLFLTLQLKFLDFGQRTVLLNPTCKEKSAINFAKLSQDQVLQLELFLEQNKTYQKQSNHLSYFPSKFVSVRAVYYDARPRSGHKNASVFLANIWKNITDNKLITGCQVGNTKAVDFEVKLIGETPLWRAYPIYNRIDHEEVLIDCFDLPATEGDQAIIYYKTSENSDIELAVSERVWKKPRPHVQPTSPEGIKYNFTVVTCTKIFGGNAPWFLEWLRYQKTIGIDHVHIDVDDYFFRELNKEKMAYVVKELKSGFLSVEPWVQWLVNGKEVWYHNQGLILEDCGYRFRGTYDFMFVLDTDDFFVPRVPNENKVHYYINKHFKGNVGSCKLRWLEFFPDRYLEHSSLKSLADGNVTSLLTNFTYYMQGNRKSVHRTQALIDTATHYAFKMIDGYKADELSVQEAYVAHVRKLRQPSFYKQLSKPP